MTDRFVDATAPDDTGTGTFASPKRTPRAGSLLAVAGDRVLFKTGLNYDPVGGLFVFWTAVSNVEMGTYGTASDKPVFDALSYEAPGAVNWEYVQDGIWKKAFALYPVRRLWIGSRNRGILTRDRVIGTAMRRATGAGLTGQGANPDQLTILPCLSATDIWFCGGLTNGTSLSSFALYVYTGSSTIDPPTFYDGLAFIQSDAQTVGGVTGIHVENQTDIYAHDLVLRGNGGSGIRLAAQNSNTRDVANCLFEDIEVTHSYNGAVISRIAGQVTPLRRCTSTTFRRIVGDYKTSRFEQEPNQTYNFLSGVSDMFSIGDGSVAITVEACTAINSAHNGIVVGSTAMRTTPPAGCKILNNLVYFFAEHTYGRGLSALDGDPEFTGNTVIGQNTRSQFSGSARVIGNVWKQLGDSVRKPTVAQAIAVESYIYLNPFGNSVGADSYLKVSPNNLYIANNTFYGAQDDLFAFNFFSNGVGANDNTWGPITLYNNIGYNMKGKFLSTYNDSGRVITTATISRNCAHNNIAGDIKITWLGVNYRIDGAAPGCTSNVEVDPQLDSEHRPHAFGLRRTGVAVVGKDYNGKQLYNPPNIGAVDDLSTTAKNLILKH